MPVVESAFIFPRLQLGVIRWFHDCRTVRPDSMTTLHTVGHGTLPAEKFASLLDGAHVARLFDVRSFPGSRHNPQFAREEMERWVPDAGIGYGWMRELGIIDIPDREGMSPVETSGDIP